MMLITNHTRKILLWRACNKLINSTILFKCSYVINITLYTPDFISFEWVVLISRSNLFSISSFCSNLTVFWQSLYWKMLEGLSLPPVVHSWNDLDMSPRHMDTARFFPEMQKWVFQLICMFSDLYFLLGSSNVCNFPVNRNQLSRNTMKLYVVKQYSRCDSCIYMVMRKAFEYNQRCMKVIAKFTILN